MRVTGAAPEALLRRRFWPPFTSQPVSILLHIASSGSTNSLLSISRGCPRSKLSGRPSVMALTLCLPPITWSSGCLATYLGKVRSLPDYHPPWRWRPVCSCCLLYTSDAADEEDSVDL